MAAPDTSSRASVADNYDAVIIGAGAGGISALIHLRNLGLTCRLFEAGEGPGGAWYWNRYPGARFDSESYSYGFFFSPDLFREWNWSEHFSGQPETEAYFNYVVDRFDLRKDMQFATRVSAARFIEGENVWEVALADGTTCRARWLIAAVGPLTTPQLPRIAGIESYAGEAYHTARWPHHPVDFAGKRVGVIGTGASGVQVIQEVAKTARHLTVFQRTANYMAPLKNGPVTPEEQTGIQSRYDELKARVSSTYAWFLHSPDPRSIFDLSDDDRERFFEERYNARGMAIWQGNFRDILTDRAANDLISDFIRRKIRERVKDPQTAEKLVPKDHGFGTRRVPHETNYFEVYNQPNVTLVDLKATPFEVIAPDGIRTSEGFHELDMLIYATGFDAVTGAFEAIDIVGVDGRELRAEWRDGPVTYLGLMTPGFPNFFMSAGPLSAQGNIPRTCEYNAVWVAELVRYMNENGLTYIEPDPAAAEQWTAHARDVQSALLVDEVDSWFTGVNANREGRLERRVVQYRGGAYIYRERSEAAIANGFPEFIKK
ncbi:flavin-containing monooxygenase [Microvirga antarctica]|uniref:flavin-containing monooxygenase n=1 Tax=Microvirga antarctica TaxID=2819233 RepID=UPI001B304BEE|nr:NAD(P)/FAD-dependent oxidoreductase [Microvirga antarctica]